jgi:hypothetical protein
MNGEAALLSAALSTAPPVIKPARRGCTVSYKGKTLLSTVDPVAQAERAAAEAVAAVTATLGGGGVSTGGVYTGRGSAGKPDQTLYFCPSPILGYGLNILLALLGPASAVLCVETDAELLVLSRASIDKTILNHSRFALTGIRDGTELCRFVRKAWGPRVFRRIKTVKLSGGWQLDSSAYETMAELLQRDIAVDWENAMTLVKLGHRYIYNAVRNLALLDRFQPITALSFGSKPVLVLGAGPSVDPLLDAVQASGLLNQSSRPFTLVCADTCLSLLRERNIVPDLAVVLESQFWNMGDFIGLRNTGIPAALDLSAYPPSAGILNGQVFFFFTPWTTLTLFERMQAAGLLPPVLPPLGSVGLTSVELARRLGSGLVITAGIDFSYILDKTHARSSPAHLAVLTTHNRFKSLLNPQAAFRNGTFTTPSKSNIPVRSDPAMRNYRSLFEQEFAADPRIFDITGTGLPLGVKTLSIEEALSLLTRPGIPGTTNPDAKVNTVPAQKPAGPVLASFIEKEKSMLEELRVILTGENTGGEGQLEALLDKADYLWAHFPDCAGAEGRRPAASDIAFLKRVRAEIDPFIALWEKSGRAVR